MKTLKITFLLLFVSFLSGYAQNTMLYEEIQQAKNYGEQFEVISAFTLANKNISHSKKIQEHFINPQEVYVLQYKFNFN
jgi:hypothetical protein